MRAGLPPWAITEEQFAEWCRDRGFDETDEAWRSYEMWLDDPSFTDPDLEPGGGEFDDPPTSDREAW